VGLTVLSPPAKRPLEADDVRRQLATHAEQGDQVDALIAAATERVESYLGRALIEQTLVYTFDRWPCERITLPRPPLVEVVEIRYLDSDGVQQTLSPSLYRVLTSRDPVQIERAFNATWPTTRDVCDAVEIEFKAGYGTDGANVPASIRHALTMIVGEWLEFREGLVVGTIAEAIPNSVKFLLDGERVGRLFAYGGEA
jgi:uncharacterized phiE125 gp8 family phage protein